MTEIRVIATDLDRTLVGPDGILTDRTRVALSAARDRRIAVVAVTARPPRVFQDWTGLPEVLDLAICANGTIYYDPREKSSLLHRTLAPETAAAAAKALRAAAPQVRFAVETGAEVIAEPGYAKTDSVLDRTFFRDSLADVLASAPPFVKLHAHVAGGSAAALLRTARGLDLEGIELWETGSRDLLELGPAGATKASALARWCTMFCHLPDHVLAFGDAPTDVPMLRWAGRSFAVAGAHPTAAEAATDQCGPYDGDGVAEVLERLLRLAPR